MNEAMGDADGEVVIQVPAQEIEAWMDEALAVVDEGFENLLTLVTSLNERTKSILLELKIVENFRKIFVALNFLIVPVVIAIMLCYRTKESVSSNSSGIEAGLQILVMFLMFVSSTVGLPFYLISIWESYRSYENINEDPNKQSSANHYPMFDDSLLTLLTNESSMERLCEFARLLNDRMPPRMRADLQRRRSTEKNSSEEQRIQLGMENSSEMEMESAATDTSYSMEPSEEKQDHSLDCAEEEAKAAEFPILYQFQVLMNEQSPSLAVRFEPTNKGERKETTENEEMLERNSQQSTDPQNGAPSYADNDEDRNDNTSPELHTCKKSSPILDNKLQNHEISC